MPCITNVTQNVCVNAQVRIRPVVTPGDPITFCQDPAFIGSCNGTLQRFCSFNVSQRLCVEIPITFDALAEATPTGIVCETEPRVGNCGEDTACTFSQGYFSTHEEFTNELILTSPGDRIILGAIDQNDAPIGLSIIVTTANADAVFAGTQPPIPVTIVDANRLGQYRNLYQQLLAANLNQLNGANCAAAQDAIEAANIFLATSPAGGTTGAPDYADDLAQFNEGEILGCPGHCPEDNG